MKKLKLFSVTGLSLILLFALAPVHAQVSVSPTHYEFDEVPVGYNAITTITVTNDNPFISEEISLIGLYGSGDFNIISSPDPGYRLDALQSVDIDVSFAPSAVGVFSTMLVIVNGGTFNIPLSGTGVAAQPPPTSIQDIIDYFDASVANGTLVGTGPGSSADGRLNALRNMLIEASYLISAGNYDGACVQLSAALQRCNDFVQGTSQDNLAQMISSLMDDLGC